MHEVHSDGAVFTYVTNGKLHGLVISNVDDLLLIGDEKFDAEIVARPCTPIPFWLRDDEDIPGIDTL